MRLALLALASCLAGCAHSGPEAGSAARGGSGGEGEAVLAVPGAAPDYDVRRPAPLEGLEARVYALIVDTATRLGRPAPQTDEAAWRAARQIARGLLPSGPPPTPLVEFAMRSHGLVDPPPHLVVATAPESGDRELFQQLEGRLASILRRSSYLRVGVGVETPLRMPGERRLLLAFFDGRVRFRPLPRELRLGQRAVLDFEVLSPHRPVRVVVASPGQGITSHKPRQQGERFTAALICQRRGIYQVEVTGDGPFGAEVLANFPVYCDQAAPHQVRYGTAVAPPGTEAELERDLFERTNALRRAHGLPAFRHNQAVAEVARRHSQDMRDQQFVGHVSPRTGGPADRLRRAKIIHLTARENVARAYSPAETLSELQKSPAHRANLLATDVDELGVGIAVDRSGPSPVLLVTQNFIRGGSRLDPAAGPAPVYQVVERRRRDEGLPPLQREASLERLAGRYLSLTLAGAEGQRRADSELSAALRRFGARFGRVEGVLVRVSALEALAQTQDLGKRGPTHIGVGVAAEAGQTAIFILLASPR